MALFVFGPEDLSLMCCTYCFSKSSNYLAARINQTKVDACSNLANGIPVRPCSCAIKTVFGWLYMKHKTFEGGILTCTHFVSLLDDGRQLVSCMNKITLSEKFLGRTRTGVKQHIDKWSEKYLQIRTWLSWLIFILE